jgi:hypothetical protein
LPDELMFRTNVAESERKGSADTVWFQAFALGNIGHPPRLGPGTTVVPPEPEPEPPGTPIGEVG